ncbi:chloride channel protein [Christiangramia fulva]|uniref:Chloride channel protein n=1 Tax=Christiangramia fulva TaxID=2126553 RepID=A0A2R3Z2A8_9FLAO|nr:chloride channel protein [Christiangramia fulva]AVR44410.1 chloride channel protein [Christiangramia fulva]
MKRKKVIYKSYGGLILYALFVGLAATFLAQSLKYFTAVVEEQFLEFLKDWPWFYFFFPSIGISLIFLTRKYFFKGKKNKGIKEIFQTFRRRKNQLPPYKISSHYLNGFLTVIFGGSTGIEVSTVVATAAIGNSTHRKSKAAQAYKTELICAGVAAGIATLFGSPIAGFLFAVEVISHKFTKTIIISCSSSVLVSWLYIHFFNGERLFDLSVINWKMEALPFMIILSLLAGLLAVYFTKIVLFIKQKFGSQDKLVRANLMALAVGATLYFLPELYGDSYHAIPNLLEKLASEPFSAGIAALLLALVILKPLVASVTLAAGGDGGVFAPSIVAGSFLGMLVAVTSNYYLGTDLIVLNFALLGGAAMLSAAIHAPLTALFLTCSIVNGGFILFVPILLATFIAKYLAKWMCSYTVYSFRSKKAHLDTPAA